MVWQAHLPAKHVPEQQLPSALHEPPAPKHAWHVPPLHANPSQHWLSSVHLSPAPRQVPTHRSSWQREPAQHGAAAAVKPQGRLASLHPAWQVP
jgi:hypothetical protein